MTEFTNYADGAWTLVDQYGNPGDADYKAYHVDHVRNVIGFVDMETGEDTFVTPMVLTAILGDDNTLAEFMTGDSHPSISEWRYETAREALTKLDTLKNGEVVDME